MLFPILVIASMTVSVPNQPRTRPYSGDDDSNASAGRILRGPQSIRTFRTSTPSTVYLPRWK